MERLCRYYLDCLGHDDQGGIGVFAASKYGNLDYAELSTLPQLADGGTGAPISDELANFLRRAARERNRLSLTLGYPVILNRVQGRSGWDGCFVEPLLLFSCAPIETPQAYPPLSDDPPDINIRALRSITGSQGSDLVDEAVHLAEELGLQEHAGLEEIVDLAATLNRVGAEWQWRERCDPRALQLTPPLKEISESGIYNRAVLVLSERSPYTRGLEAELTKLRGLRPSAIEDTALGAWLRGQVEVVESQDAGHLLEPVPLNTEQRHATRDGLSRALTVITGPPGTGKSQVVTSLLINAAWRGQTVLFASKNNKAVDVVEARVNALGPRPVLLRLGATEQQERIGEYLVSLLAAATSNADAQQHEDLLQVHHRLSAKAAELDASLGHTISLRNQVDHLDQTLQVFRADLGEGAFAALRSFDAAAAREDAKQLSAAVESADRSKQNVLARSLWPFVRAGRHQRVGALASELRHLASALGLPAPAGAPADDSVGQWRDFVSRLAKRVEDASHAREYFAALEKLGTSQRPEFISAERLALTEVVAKNSTALWSSWLRLQPARLDSAGRKALGEYSALVQMIARSKDTGQSLGRQVFARYYSLFPGVARQLSCWAITSLSAKSRIPFEPAFFDVLVIDEASQCDIASALPLLYRAKRAVIIGDPKQLRHISAIRESLDQRLLAKHQLFQDGGAGWSYSTVSLFDRAVSLTTSKDDIVELRDHHRSHADIIEFANRRFYEGRLRVATRYDRLRRPSSPGPAVRWVDVKGGVSRPPSGGAVNHVEAGAVVNELRRLVLEHDYRGTIGVVSPFRAQANRIRELATRDDELARRLVDAEFLVDTVHRFQGDERDLIVFSPALSADMPDGATHFLMRTPNLFNVAITRARASLVVVGDLAAAAASRVEYLAEFATYTATLGGQTAEATGQRVTDYGPDYPSVSNRERVSDWERVLYSALYRSGLRPIVQYDVEKYTLDFALIAGNRRLNIEVDGEHYHRQWNGELARRDQIRNQRLIELGWDVVRFWVYEIRDDLDGCISRVRDWCSGPAHSSVPAR